MRGQLNSSCISKHRSGGSIWSTGIALALAAAIAGGVALIATATPSSEPQRSTAESQAQHAWPPESLNHLDVVLESSQGRRIPFAAGGRVRIVTLFYATCPMACPLTLDTLRNLEGGLTPSERARLDVVLITLDPEHDTVVALHDLAVRRRIDERRWTLGRASVSDTRMLAGALGIQYRQLDDGSFNHASILILLDSEGRIAARSGKMGEPDAQFVAAVRRLIGATGQ